MAPKNLTSSSSQSKTLSIFLAATQPNQTYISIMSVLSQRVESPKLQNPPPYTPHSSHQLRILNSSIPMNTTYHLYIPHQTSILSVEPSHSFSFSLFSVSLHSFSPHSPLFRFTLCVLWFIPSLRNRAMGDKGKSKMHHENEEIGALNRAFSTKLALERAGLRCTKCEMFGHRATSCTDPAFREFANDFFSLLMAEPYFVMSPIFSRRTTSASPSPLKIARGRIRNKSVVKNHLPESEMEGECSRPYEPEMAAPLGDSELAAGIAVVVADGEAQIPAERTTEELEDHRIISSLEPLGIGIPMIESAVADLQLAPQAVSCNQFEKQGQTEHVTSEGVSETVGGTKRKKFVFEAGSCSGPRNCMGADSVGGGADSMARPKEGRQVSTGVVPPVPKRQRQEPSDAV